MRYLKKIFVHLANYLRLPFQLSPMSLDAEVQNETIILSLKSFSLTKLFTGQALIVQTALGQSYIPNKNTAPLMLYINLLFFI
jgi:hypothetical protein